jgi:hypothetical protein
MRRLFAIVGVAGALLFAAAPAFAHDCFNPNKPELAGVHYELTGFDADGNPIFVQLGNGQGIGGFALIAADALFPGSPQLEAHTIGNSPSLDVVGGPGSQTAQHACDGKGIDYIDACFAGQG